MTSVLLTLRSRLPHALLPARQEHLFSYLYTTTSVTAIPTPKHPFSFYESMTSLRNMDVVTSDHLPVYHDASSAACIPLHPLKSRQPSGYSYIVHYAFSWAAAMTFVQLSVYFAPCDLRPLFNHSPY